MRKYLELGLGLSGVVPMAVYIFGWVVILVTLFYRLEPGLYYLVILIPLQNLQDYIAKYPLGQNFLDYLLLAIILRWIIKRENSNGKLFMETPFNGVILILGLWTFLGLWVGTFMLNLPSPFSSATRRLNEWKIFMTLPLLYFIIVNNVKEVKKMRYLLMLMTFSMIVMGRSFYTNFGGGDHYNESDRIGGTFSYLGPNELSAFYAQYSIILIALAFLDESRWRRFLFSLTAFINYYCVAFLFSRGGYLATLVSWLWQAFMRNRIVIVPLLLMLVFWESLLPVAVIERISMTQQEDGVDRSSQERLGLWEQGKAAFFRSPVMGIGFNTIRYYGFTDGITTAVRRSLHNGYLEEAVELGAIGLLLFLTIFGLAMYSGWRLYRLAPDGFSKGLGVGFVGCVLACLVANFFSQNWHYINVMGYFWVCLGLIVRRTIVLQEEKLAHANNMVQKTELTPTRQRVILQPTGF